MSIIYCERHDRRWDSDKLEECPSCESSHVPCMKCAGLGLVRRSFLLPLHAAEPAPSQMVSECRDCKGTGYLIPLGGTAK